MAFRRLAAFAAGLLITLGLWGQPAQAKTVTVFAAASTTDALTAAARLFEADTGHRVVLVFGSSSTLAKQIQEGAPADLFLSANRQWMDALAAKMLLVAESRANILGNALVLVAPAESKAGRVAIAPGFPLARLLGDGRLSVGDPDHVPAGQYARQALESLGVWAAVAPRLARATDARAALTLVERGETPYGIVYATDAAASRRVKVVGEFPAGTHPPIAYPVALVAGRDTPEARAFLAFLLSPMGRAEFAKLGFRVGGRS